MECLTDCLQIRNLPYHFTSQKLTEYLANLPGGIEGVSSQFVTRNKVDFPTGFAKFNSVQQAQECQEKINASYPTWEVMYYPPPAAPKWQTTLVITNLPTNSSLPQGQSLCDWQRAILVNAFLSIQLPQPKSIRIQYSSCPTGTAYVQYTTPELCAKAIELFGQTQPALKITMYPRATAQVKPTEQDTVKIEGLAEGTDEDRLRTMCNELNTTDKPTNLLVTGVKNPIGFVKYSSAHAAHQASQYINIQLKGLSSEVVGAMPPACDMATICIRGLEPGSNEVDVKHIMRQVGNETDPTHVVVTGASHPVGYARFANANDARLALVGLHQKFGGLDTEIVQGASSVSDGDCIRIDGLAPGANESTVRSLLQRIGLNINPSVVLVHGVNVPVAYARYRDSQTARRAHEGLVQHFNKLVIRIVQGCPAVNVHDCVRVQNLSPGANEDTVLAILRQVGVSTAPYSVVVFGATKPTALCRYRNPADAAEAVRGLRQNFGGLDATLAREPNAPGAKDTLKVEGLPSGTTEAAFLHMLRNRIDVGVEPEFVLVHGTETPTGYVRYNDEHTAERARQQLGMNSNLICSVSHRPSTQGAEQKRTLYIGKIGDWSEAIIRENVRAFGQIESLTVVNGPNGRFAIVKFFNAADAKRACDALPITHAGLDVYWSDFQDHLKSAVSNFWRDMDVNCEGVASFPQWYKVCREHLPLVSRAILREAFDQLDHNGDELLHEVDVKTQLFRIIRSSPSCDTLVKALRHLVEQNTFGKKVVSGTACPSFEQSNTMIVQNKTHHNQHDVNEQLRLTKQKIAAVESRLETISGGYGPAREAEFSEGEIQQAFEKNACSGAISICKHFDALMRDLSKRGHKIHAADIPKLQKSFIEFNGDRDQANYREFRTFVYRVLNA